jgi:hypothetical protein
MPEKQKPKQKAEGILSKPLEPVSMPTIPAGRDRTEFYISRDIAYQKISKVAKGIEKAFAALESDDREIKEEIYHAAKPAKDAYLKIMERIKGKSLPEQLQWLETFARIVATGRAFIPYIEYEYGPNVEDNDAPRKKAMEALCDFTSCRAIGIEDLRQFEKAIASLARSEPTRIGEQQALAIFWWGVRNNHDAHRNLMDFVGMAAKTSEMEASVALMALISLGKLKRLDVIEGNALFASREFVDFVARFGKIKDSQGTADESCAFWSFAKFLERAPSIEAVKKEMTFAEKYIDNSRLGAYFGICGCDIVKSQPNETEKMRKALGMIFTFDKLGLEYFQRYSPKILENAYLTATDPEFSKNKRVAFVGLNKSDWNWSFTKKAAALEELIDRGYALAIWETKWDVDLIFRFLNNGMVAGASSALGSKTCDLAVIGGHGNPAGTTVGNELATDSKGSGSLALDDYMQDHPFMPGVMAPKLSKKATIVLWSCGTGNETPNKEEKELISHMGNAGNFKNMMFMVGALANAKNDGKVAKVIAPKISTSMKRFKFEKDGFVSGAEYDEGESIVSVYSPKRD